MKLKDIRIMAQLEVDREISTGIALTHANNFLKTLPIEYETMRIEEKVEIECTDTHEYYSLGSDILDVKHVKIKNDSSIFKNYETDNREIRFDILGEYTVTVERFPNLITNETDEPEVDAVFHPSMAMYMTYKEMARLYEEEDESVQRKKEELNLMLENAHTQKRRRTKRRRTIRSPRW